MNKNLAYYMSLDYSMEFTEDKEDGGYAVSFPDLPGCISCGETLQEAYDNAMDAKECWLIAALEDGYPIKEPLQKNSFSGRFVVRIPKSLHCFLASEAKREGVSLNQLCIAKLSR